MLLEISGGRVTETGQAKMPSDVACLDITPFATVSQCNSSPTPCITEHWQASSHLCSSLTGVASPLEPSHIADLTLASMTFQSTNSEMEGKKKPSSY